MRNVGLKGKQKLADIWGKHPCIIKSQSEPGIPVYEVQQENSRAKSKLLHRNMLLPFCGLPVPTEPKPHRPIRPQQVTANEDAYEEDSSSSSTEDPIDKTVPRYVIPQRRRRQKLKHEEERRKSSSVSELRDTDDRTRDTNFRRVSSGQDATDSYIQITDDSYRSSSRAQEPTRRGSRQRQPPQWMRTGDWQVQYRPYTIVVDPSQIVEL